MEQKVKKSKRIRYPKKNKQITPKEQDKKHFVLEVHDSVGGLKSQI